MVTQRSPLALSEPQFVVVNDQKLAYEEVCPPAPSGTVLLLTGLASKRQGWRMQMAPFGAVYRTIAMDHRDSGDSFQAAAPYSTADQADDAAGLLRALDIKQTHVVGISMGGFVALELALRHPDLVDRLVLVSTSAGGATHVRPGLRMRIALRLPRPRRGDIGKLAKRTYKSILAPGYAARHPEVLETIALVARYRPQTPEAYRRQLHSCTTHDVSSRLDAIRQRTLVVHGDVDPLVRTANGRYLAAHIPGARLIIYEQTGHVPIIERAGDFNRDVLAFLAEP